MFRQPILAFFACFVVAGCASTAELRSPPSPQGEAPESARFRFAGAEADAQPILLRPTRVEDLVVRGPGAGCTVLIGALFGSRTQSGRASVGVALVLQAVGAPLGPALAAPQSIEVWIDGQLLVQSPIEGGKLYYVEVSRMGPVETLLVPIDPVHLANIAAGERVEIRLGSDMEFRLGEGHRRDFGDLASRITEDLRATDGALVAQRLVRKGQ